MSDEIRAKRATLLPKLAEAQRRVEKIQRKLRDLRADCKHPQGRSYRDRDGSSSMDCPDCGGT